MSSSKKNLQHKKARRKRRRFTAEFKADVVRLCESGGESIGEVSRRLDLTDTAVRAWVKQAAAWLNERVPNSYPQAAAISRESRGPLRGPLLPGGESS